jgi:hypothetical protein
LNSGVFVPVLIVSKWTPKFSKKIIMLHIVSRIEDQEKTKSDRSGVLFTRSCGIIWIILFDGFIEFLNLSIKKILESILTLLRPGQNPRIQLFDFYKSNSKPFFCLKKLFHKTSLFKLSVFSKVHFKIRISVVLKLGWFLFLFKRYPCTRIGYPTFIFEICYKLSCQKTKYIYLSLFFLLRVSDIN